MLKHFETRNIEFIFQIHMHVSRLQERRPRTSNNNDAPVKIVQAWEIHMEIQDFFFTGNSILYGNIYYDFIPLSWLLNLNKITHIQSTYFENMILSAGN